LRVSSNAFLDAPIAPDFVCLFLRMALTHKPAATKTEISCYSPAYVASACCKRLTLSIIDGKIFVRNKSRVSCVRESDFSFFETAFHASASRCNHIKDLLKP
jgi:hypothetical protein